MGRHRRTQVRAQALRQARQSQQARDARRIGRSRKVEEALADYFESIRHAEAIHDRAMARAARVLTGADQEIVPLRARGAAALQRMARLGETQTGIAELVGLSRAAVRELLVEAASAAGAGTPSVALPEDRNSASEPDSSQEPPPEPPPGAANADAMARSGGEPAW